MSDDDDLKLLLGGKPKEQEQGLAALYDAYSRPLWSFLLKRFPGLAADVGEIVDDTFCAVWRRIGDGTFDLNRPLGSFLFNVAQKKAIDRLRKYKARVDMAVDDDIEEVASRIRDTEAGHQWRYNTARERSRAIQEAFLIFLRSLPDVQRNVAQVMADNFPDELGQEETANEIYRRTGVRQTVASIKRSRTVIREKFKEYLSKTDI